MNFYKIFFLIAFMLVIGMDLSEARKHKKDGEQNKNKCCKNNKVFGEIAAQAIQTGGEIVNALLNRNQANRNNNRPPIPYDSNY